MQCFSVVIVQLYTSRKTVRMYRSFDLFLLTTGLTNRLASSLQEVEMYHSKVSCHFTILHHGSINRKRLRRMKKKNRRTKNRKRNLFQKSLRKQKKRQKNSKRSQRSTYSGNIIHKLVNTGERNYKLSGTAGFWRRRSQTRRMGGNS